MNLVWATITALDDGVYHAAVDGRDGQSRVIVYPDLTGPVALGDRVLLNTTAVDLDLGTGGDHFVVARIPKDGQPYGVALSDESGGHIMKLRYSPLQRDVLTIEAPESSTHAVMRGAVSLEGVPVVCCGLHSQVPVVAATVKAHAPHLRVGYVMTDQAALHLGYSRLIAQCVEEGLIDATITVGQAIGGQREAVTLHSGLLGLCHLDACEVIITAIGPGVAGTGTPFGHGGIAQGEAINAVAALGGRPIAVLRMSFADERQRHRGISHHTLTALESVALAEAVIAVPFLEDPAQRAEVEKQLDGLAGALSHQGVFFAESVFDEQTLRHIDVRTMGRGPQHDPIFFEAAAAAGVVAAQIGAAASEQAFAAFAQTRSNITEQGCSPDACAGCGRTCTTPLTGQSEDSTQAPIDPDDLSSPESTDDTD